MLLKQKLMIGATALLGMGIGSIGLGVAHASPNTGAAVVQANTNGPDTEATVPGQVDPAGGPNDQVGSQSGPDTPGADTPEAATAGQVDAPGGPNDQSGAQSGPNDQSGPDTGGADTGAAAG